MLSTVAASLKVTGDKMKSPARVHQAIQPLWILPRVAHAFENKTNTAQTVCFLHRYCRCVCFVFRCLDLMSRDSMHRKPQFSAVDQNLTLKPKSQLNEMYEYSFTIKVGVAWPPKGSPLPFFLALGALPPGPGAAGGRQGGGSCLCGCCLVSGLRCSRRIGDC